jgi:SAM-dependent methyltransferase
MADFSIRVDDMELRSRLESVIDREDKIPRALDALGPLAGQRVVLLDTDRGVRARQLEALGARVSPLPGLEMSALPRGLADAVVSCWAGFQGGSPDTEPLIGEAERVLRTGGRLLIVHDYGRDDIARLLGDDEMERQHIAWSRRDGWFLLHDFKVRVLHCWWTFDSLEEAHDLLVLAFGSAGTEVATGMRRPRLEYKVAVYHRTMGVDVEDPQAADRDPPSERGAVAERGALAEQAAVAERWTVAEPGVVHRSAAGQADA